jgi:hypothetical protein
MAAVLAMGMGALACAHKPPASPQGNATENVCSSSASAVEISGDFTPEDLAAIKATVGRENDEPVMSIVQREEGVDVMTGCVCGPLDGNGHTFRLRKVNGVWAVVERSEWAA